MKPTHPRPSHLAAVPGARSVTALGDVAEVTITPADILRGAARYLELYGWHTGALLDIEAAAGTPFPPVCADAAIGMAVLGDATRITLVEDPDETPVAIAHMVNEAERVLAGYLWTEPDDDWMIPVEVIGDWNDETGRTAAEVIETLRDAANHWERLHPTGGTR